MTNHLDIESDRLMGLIVKYEHNGTAANCQILVRATLITVPKLIAARETWRRRAEKAEQALRQYVIGLDGHEWGVNAMTNQRPLDDYEGPAPAALPPAPWETPGPYFLARHIPWTECGCEPRVSIDTETYGMTRIVYCPTHAAAPRMLRWIDNVLHGRGTDGGAPMDPLLDEARAILRDVEG